MMNRLKFSLIWLVSGLAATGAFAAESTAAPAKATAPAPDSFQVRNVKFGDLLRPEEANSADGTRIVLYSAQPWKCMTWRFHPAGESAFYLQNHFTSKTFSASAGTDGAPAPVTQVPFSKEAAKRPTWQFTKLPGGAYKVTEAKSGRALTAVKAEGGSGVRIVVEAWQDKDEQKWELQKIDPAQLTM